MVVMYPKDGMLRVFIRVNDLLQCFIAAPLSEHTWSLNSIWRRITPNKVYPLEQRGLMFRQYLGL